MYYGVHTISKRNLKKNIIKIIAGKFIGLCLILMKVTQSQKEKDHHLPYMWTLASYMQMKVHIGTVQHRKEKNQGTGGLNDGNGYKL